MPTLSQSLAGHDLGHLRILADTWGLEFSAPDTRRGLPRLTRLILDPELVGEVLEVMRQLAQKGMTMLVVTHEMGFAKEVGNQLIFMDDGVIVEKGEPAEVFNNPQHNRAKEFFRMIL